jgi:cytochrome P450
VSVLGELEDLGRRIGADVERFVREGEQELGQHFTEHPQPLFALLRTLKPVLVIHDIAIVTRYADVLAVLGDDDAFGVEPYGVKMRALAGDFILGLDDSLQYEREVSILRLAAPRSDIPPLGDFVTQVAEQLIAEKAAQDGLLDVVELAKEVPARLFARWFGTPDADVRSLTEWTMPMFDDIFFNVTNDPRIHAAAEQAVGQLRPCLEGAVAARKQGSAGGVGGADVLGRLLEMQANPATELSDAQIATNLIGMVVGFIPTVATAVPLAIDALLERPDALAGAQRAARGDDDEAVREHMWEAMRLAPFAAGVLRRTSTDALVAADTHHATHIPAGTLTLAATQSAMLDGDAIDDPDSFRIGRPAGDYVHFGAGLHHCFGRFANDMQLPLIAKALLRRPGLARAPGEQGGLIREGPYAKSLVVSVDRLP